MKSTDQYPVVRTNGAVTHVMVPVEDFERMSHGRAEAASPSNTSIDRAIEIWNDPKTRWHDAGSVFQEIVRTGIEQVRRARKMSQRELGEKVDLSQPQVSRLESSPDSATVGTLRRIAAALAASDRDE